ncbi:MAG: hypothetical protein ACLGG7_07630 [Bacteriovoracia bacterium]
MDTTVESSQAPQVSEGLKFLLGQSHQDLFAVLEEILTDGGALKLGVKEVVRKIERQDFRYLDPACEWVQGHAYLSFSPEGGFILNTALAENGLVSEKWDLYDTNGTLVSTNYVAPDAMGPGSSLEMDLSCPLLDSLYNFHSTEYGKAGKATQLRSTMVHAVERFLRTRYKTLGTERRKDPLIRHVFHKILIIEADPVLNWEERQLVYDSLIEGLKKALQVKRRALGKGLLSQHLDMFRFKWASFARRFKARPWDNFQGLFYRYTIAKILWFFMTVKGNLGYSVALAVYGPFTYYFITMPMNPHAMQAVGTVRSTYLDLKSGMDQVKGLFSNVPGVATSTPVTVPEAPAASVESAPAANPELPQVSAPNLNPNFIDVSYVTKPSKSDYQVKIDGKVSSVTPTYLNLLMTNEIPAIDQINWSERMGNFKQMQIAYEEALEYAPRMGRLEQLETQYNFPMVVESAWEEMERYNNRIFKLRQREQNLSPKMKQFLTNEVNRTQQLELYLWDRLARFILDQPYVMLDEAREQKRNDYYVGRAFVFMEEMTQVLSWRYPDFKKPHGYEKIAAAAGRYKSERKEQGSIMANLKANSDLFRQKDSLSSAEFRSYMKRQWEILFLQNAKAEEASNNGLNMYIWSVRNTVWVLQSLYSAKRQELELLIERDLSGQLDGLGQSELAKTELLQETLFHNLTLEWVGVKEEIGSHLAKDIETLQRKVVIDNLKESLSDRSKLLNQFSVQAQASR